jgi:asparagine synthase (glutamine-hydrolysing)
MSEIIPASITDSPKKGFSSPDASWFRGDSIEFVVKRLFSQHSKLYQLFDFEFTKKLYEDHTKGDVNRRLLIWSLLSFQSLLDRE